MPFKRYLNLLFNNESILASFHEVLYKNRIIISIGRKGVVVLNIKNSKLVDRFFIEDIEDNDIFQIQKCIKNNSDSPVYIILNNHEQLYSVQSVPFLNTLSSRLFIKMRINKDFGSYELKASVLLDTHDNYDNKNRRYLFAASKVNDIVLSWLEFVMKYSSNFKGILLFPIELVKVLNKLSAVYTATPSDWTMMVSYTKVSGFNHLVLNKKKFYYTRLLRDNYETVPDIIAGGISQEIQNTIQYLRKLDLKENDNIDIFIIVPEPVKASLLTIKCFQYKFNVLTPHELSKLLNLSWSTKVSDQFGDTVTSCAIFEKPPIVTFYTKKTKTFSNLIFINKYIFPVFSFLFLFIIAMDTIYSLNIKHNFSYISVINEKEKDLNSQLDQLNHDNYVERVYRMHDVINVYKVLSGKSHSPLDQIAILNKLDLRNAKITSFAWQQSKDNTTIIKLQFLLKNNEHIFEINQSLIQDLERIFTDYKITVDKIDKAVNYVKVDVHMESSQ